MYAVCMFIQLDIHETDDVSVIGECYHEIIEKRSSKYKVLDLHVTKDDKEDNFHVYLELDILKEDENKKGVRGVVCELEEYYKEVIERASSQDNLLKLYVLAGRAEEKK